MASAAANALQDEQAQAQQLSRLVWLLTGLTVAASLAGANLAGVRIVHGPAFLATSAACIGPLMALRFYAQRRGLGGPRLPVFLDVVAAYMIFAFALVVAQHAAGAHAVPDKTALVERLDGAMGFRWFDYVRRVSAVPLLDSLLGCCYRNWIAEFMVAMAALAFVRDYKAIGEFTVAYVLSGAATIVCFASFDVMSLHSVAAFHLAGFHHPSASGPDYLRALRQLRSGADRTLDFSHIEGLISFPSLHGASALLLAAATRSLGRWRYPFLAFNVLVLVSTLSEGGHGAVDELAAIALACAALALAPSLHRLLTGGVAAAIPAPGAQTLPLPAS